MVIWLRKQTEAYGRRICGSLVWHWLILRIRMLWHGIRES